MRWAVRPSISDQKNGAGHFQKDHLICMCLTRGFFITFFSMFLIIYIYLCLFVCYCCFYLFVIVAFICFAFFTDQVLHYFMLFVIFPHRTYCDCGPRLSTVKFHIAWGWMIFYFWKKILSYTFYFVCECIYYYYFFFHFSLCPL